jgi:transcriptional regulator with XRE-family HTH domain
VEHEQYVIGRRVAAWRGRRGLSQRVLAGLAGISQPYLSQIETGLRAVDRHSTLISLADALRVSLGELIGQPGDPTNPINGKTTATVAAIRAAIITRPERPTRPGDGASIDAAMAAAIAKDHLTLGPMLPALIGSCTGTDLVRAGYAATLYLRDLGYSDLSREAATLALAWARRDEVAPMWLGVAEFLRVWSLPPETASFAAEEAVRAADDLQRFIADPDTREVYGMLHLAVAQQEAIAGDASSARSHLDEAAAEALTLGDPADGRGVCSLAFGPTNVGLWRMAVNNELGEPEAAISAAEGVDPRRTRVPSRQAYYWMDLAQALAAVRRDQDAITALLRAEAICPLWVRIRKEVHDTVNVVLTRTQRHAVSAPLRRAAQMVGINIR